MAGGCNLTNTSTNQTEQFQTWNMKEHTQFVNDRLYRYTALRLDTVDLTSSCCKLQS